MLIPATRFYIAAVSVLAIVAAALCACASSPDPATRPATSPATTPAPSVPAVVGGDRDAHGCIGSAGYTWCAREDACVRPWELAAQRGFAKGDAAAFAEYCAGSAR